jgi:superoxide dismutase, Fe-Mn family
MIRYVIINAAGIAGASRDVARHLHVTTEIAMSFTAKKLPYPLTALAPQISRETLEYHHGKHYTGYVNKLNALIEDTPLAKLELFDIVRQGPATDCFDLAAQAWNHEFYFECLSPDGARAPHGELAASIDRSFGSFEALCAEFRSHAESLFGSGWTWLVITATGELEIVDTPNAHNPINDGKTPLLTCDVWEHAYYIDYRHERPDYVDGYLTLVDWDFVAANLAAAKIARAA